MYSGRYRFKLSPLVSCIDMYILGPGKSHPGPHRAGVPGGVEGGPRAYY